MKRRATSRSKLTAILLSCAAFGFAVADRSHAQATRVMGEGSDSGQMLIAVLGDGYDANDIATGTFADDVQRLIIDGIFRDEVFSEYKRNFNIYRFDVVSNESGVSTPERTKDTVLGTVFNGLWKDCWIQGKAGVTDRSIDSLLRMKLYDYVVVILNNADRRAGCHPGGNLLYVTKGVPPSLITHEFGHAVGSLFDEYVAADYREHFEPLNLNNCSNDLNRASLDWGVEVLPDTPIPTLQIPSGANSNEFVGMFEGCKYARRGLYRPMLNCRMRDPRSPNAQFCKICRRLLHTSLLQLRAKKIDEAVNLPTSSYLKMEIVLDKSDSKITRLEYFQMDDGSAPILASTSNYVFEFTKAGKTISVGSLGQDPFEVRAFPDEENNLGEQLAPKENVKLVLTIPSDGLPDLQKDRLKLNLYEVDLGRLKNGSKLINIDKLNLEQLKKSNLLNRRFQINTNDFKNLKLKP